MATWNYELAEPPSEPRARELWLQHVAGFIIFEDVRRYAIESIDPTVSAEARSVALKGIDDAVYGLMSIIDGVTGGVSNSRHNVSIDFIAKLTKREAGPDEEAILSLDLGQGEGMCMGYHGWLEGDFGDDAIAVQHPVQ